MLLTRFLESCTIGVAIDGLNEVDRTRAVAAFSRSFNEAPMLVTSSNKVATASPLGACLRISSTSHPIGRVCISSQKKLSGSWSG
jgi:hypothetical protein